MCSKANVVLLTLIGIFGSVSSFTSDELRVTLSNESKLIGRYLRSFKGRPIKGFTNIPYAKPPIGNLRFKDAEPLSKWDGEYKAIDEAPMCSQRDPFTRSYDDSGTEDCLYLNVYVPHMFDEKKSSLPVMVFFHGGGFVCGAGSSHEPDYLLDHDVILVTANYRLGPLGFLSTEDEHCPGNFGLKDQVMVLKWVQKNIQQFGGDPKSVTIFGSSAGGVSVTYLMASPLTEGLFSKAIAQSGTNLAAWAQPHHKGVAKKRAKQLAEKFNCYDSKDWSQTIECLRFVPAVNITAAFYDFFRFDMFPWAPFLPVVEPKLPGAFLTEHPRDIMIDKALKIPFLTGITYDEGLLTSAALFNLPGLFDELADNLDNALPFAFYYDHHDLEKQKTITDKIKQFYFNNELTREKDLNLTNLFGDGLFATAMDIYLRQRLSHAEASPTFVYLLTHKSSVSLTEIFKGDPDTYYGVAHGDNNLYLFPLRENLFPSTLPTKEDEQIRESTIQMFVDFASTGNPTPASSPLPKWKAANEFPLNYYRIGNFHFESKPMFGMESDGMFEERFKFWRELGAHLPATHSSKDEL